MRNMLGLKLVKQHLHLGADWQVKPQNCETVLQIIRKGGRPRENLPSRTHLTR